MEASQASEAGSIPVARSTPARPRAGRFCYSCAGCAQTTEIRRTSSTRGNPAHTDGCDTVQRGKCTTRGSDTPCGGFVWSKPPTTADVESASSPTRPGRSASQREKTRPAWPLQRLCREKTRPARTKTPNVGCFKHAGRTISRFRDDTGPRGELFRAQMKPPPPLLARSRVRMKPATPLLAHNATKTNISGEQR